MQLSTALSQIIIIGCIRFNTKNIIEINLNPLIPERGIEAADLAQSVSPPGVRRILLYRDNGPGLPLDYSLEKSTSLGMKVIQLLTKQLGKRLLVGFLFNGSRIGKS